MWRKTLSGRGRQYPQQCRLLPDADLLVEELAPGPTSSLEGVSPDADPLRGELSQEPFSSLEVAARSRSKRCCDFCADTVDVGVSWRAHNATCGRDHPPLMKKGRASTNRRELASGPDTAAPDPQQANTDNDCPPHGLPRSGTYAERKRRRGEAGRRQRMFILNEQREAAQHAPPPPAQSREQDPPRVVLADTAEVLAGRKLFEQLLPRRVSFAHAPIQVRTVLVSITRRNVPGLDAAPTVGRQATLDTSAPEVASQCCGVCWEPDSTESGPAVPYCNCVMGHMHDACLQQYISRKNRPQHERRGPAATHDASMCLGILRSLLGQGPQRCHGCMDSLDTHKMEATLVRLAVGDTRPFAHGHPLWLMATEGPATDLRTVDLPFLQSSHEHTCEAWQVHLPDHDWKWDDKWDPFWDEQGEKGGKF